MHSWKKSLAVLSLVLISALLTLLSSCSIPEETVGRTAPTSKSQNGTAAEFETNTLANAVSVALPDKLYSGAEGCSVEALTTFDMTSNYSAPWSFYGGFPHVDYFWLRPNREYTQGIYDYAPFSDKGVQLTEFACQNDMEWGSTRGYFEIHRVIAGDEETLYYSLTNGEISETEPEDTGDLWDSPRHTVISGPREDRVAEGYSFLPGTDVGRQGLAGPDGEVICDPAGYLFLPWYTDDLEVLLYMDPEGSWHFVDRTGMRLFETKYDKADGFFRGVAVVIENGKVGFIDRDGEKLLDTVFSDCLAYNPNTMVFLMEYTSADETAAWGLVKVELA